MEGAAGFAQTIFTPEMTMTLNTPTPETRAAGEGNGDGNRVHGPAQLKLCLPVHFDLIQAYWSWWEQ